MTIAIPDTEQLLDKGATLAGKWGAGSVCGVLIVIAGIIGAFKGAPTVWDDLMEKERVEIVARQTIEAARLKAETEARALERDLQKSTVAAILARQDAANDRLGSINDELKTNGEQIAKGFAAAGEMLKGISSDTSKMLTLKQSDSARRNPVAVLPAPLIRPLYTLIPHNTTPDT